MPSEDSLPASTQVGGVAVVVNDLDQHVTFYRDVVGFDVRRRDANRATLGTESGRLLTLVRDPDTPERSVDEAGLFHVAFRVSTRAALADALERVRDHWTLTGASDHLVSEALYLSDPEGNGVEIYCDRPEEEWPVTPEGRVAMETRPLDLDDLRSVASGSTDAPADTDVGHVHLEVTDLSRSRSFYVDGLGLTARQSVSNSALFLAAGTYHHHVGLNVWNGRSVPATGRGLAWFELVVPDEAVLDAVRSRLGEWGTAVESTADGFTVTDPDDITVRFRT